MPFRSYPAVVTTTPTRGATKGVPKVKRGRSFVCVQLPILDLRRFASQSSSRRLPRPNWPDPVAGTEFVRSVGGVRLRPAGPIYGWDGEVAFCEASRLLRFTEDPGDSRESLSVLFRRLYGFEYGYRLDIGFVAHSPDRVGWEALTTRALQLGVTVPGQSHELMLQSAGETLAAFLARATSASPARTEAELALVRACGPAVLIETMRPDLDEAELTLRTNGPQAPCYQVAATRKRLREVRRLRGCIWRLHTELEFLRAIGRAVRPEELALAPESVADLIGQLTENLASEKRDGLRQPPLIALAAQFGALSLQDLLELASAVEYNSVGLARRLQLAAERATEQRAVAEAASNGLTISSMSVEEMTLAGNIIQAGSGATVVVDSTVINSFNSVQAQDPELAQALAEVLAAVDKMQDGSAKAEAKELADALVESAESGKKAIFRASWDRLRAIAPVVGSIATVTGAIARFLGVA